MGSTEGVPGPWVAVNRRGDAAVTWNDFYSGPPMVAVRPARSWLPAREEIRAVQLTSTYWARHTVNMLTSATEKARATIAGA
ncbi:MAG TPA: hypothetical protein VFP34_13810 [Microlunatus sp.]|nr:hypothetical protein [Microlunatus sp.]